jgi:hypothetical protein
LLLAAVAPAASSLSNSLTGFTGASPNVPTQTAVGAAGLEFASINGLAEDFSSDPTVAFDANGATFGTLYAGDNGRNYMRTIDSYAFDNFVAEVTVTTSIGLTTQQFWFGIGSGDITNWGTPDFFGVPTVFTTAGVGVYQSNGANGITGDWENPCAAGWCSWPAEAIVEAPATYRMRISLDPDAKTLVGEFDIDYAGGPFVADVATDPYDLTNWYDDGVFVLNGWPTQPSKIYFGGDDGVVFKDLSIVVASAGVPGDFDGDGDVDGRDFLAWQRGESPNGTPGGPTSAADLATWQGAYNGGALSAVTVPEPSSALLLVLGLLGTCRRGWKS